MRLKSGRDGRNEVHENTDVQKQQTASASSLRAPSQASTGDQGSEPLLQVGARTQQYKDSWDIRLTPRPQGTSRRVSWHRATTSGSARKLEGVPLPAGASFIQQWRVLSNQSWKGEQVDSKAHPRALLVGVSVLSSFLLSGVIFGFPGLLEALTVEAKAFASLCKPGVPLPCKEQYEQLTAAFTVGATLSSLSCVPMGFVLDATGPRFTTIASSLLFSFGLLCFTLAPYAADNLYFLAFGLIGFAGTPILLAVLNFGELFPSVSSAIITAQNGAGNASSLVFVVMGKAVIWFGVSLGYVALIYQAVPIAVIAIAAVYFPDRPFGIDKAIAMVPRSFTLSSPRARSRSTASERGSNATEEKDSEQWRLYNLRLDGIRNRHLDETWVDPERETDTSHILPPTPPDDIFDANIWKQITSVVFVLLTLVTGYFYLHFDFYLATVNRQLAFTASAHGLGPEEAKKEVSHLVDALNLIMSIGSIPCIPIVGWITVKYGLLPALSLSLLLSPAMSALQILGPSIPLQLQVLHFCFFTLQRCLYFGVVAAFTGQVFGFLNYGRLMGLSQMAICLATPIQMLLVTSAEDTWHGDYRPVDGIMFAVGLILTFGVPLYLWQCIYYKFFFRPNDEVDSIPVDDLEQYSMLPSCDVCRQTS